MHTTPHDDRQARSSPTGAEAHEVDRPPGLPKEERVRATTAEDVLLDAGASGKVIRGSIWRVIGNAGGIILGLATATLLLRHLGVAESGRYVTVMSIVAVAGGIGDAGLNMTGSRDLALRAPAERRALLANFLALRLMIMPIGVLAGAGFALLAGYPERMVIGTVMAGTGIFILASADAALLRLTVELRNAPLAFVDFFKQATTLAGVALLVALGARLTPFFAIQIVVGVLVVALTPLLVGPHPFPRPRFDRSVQRSLLTRSLPVAMSIIVGQLYFRLVIVLMSIIAPARQTGYFGGSLRAMEALIMVPILVASVALPLLAAAGRDDRVRLRHAVEGMSEGAVIAGVFVVLVTVRAAEPVMVMIGGPSFRPAGSVLSIQAAALLFIALYQIWTATLVAVGHQRDLILTNIVALLGVSAFAALLVPAWGARGGAAASVLGDCLLASLIYWRMRRAAGRIVLRASFLARVAVAALIAALALLAPDIPNLAAAALAGLLFIGVGQIIGMIPRELWHALKPSALLAR